MTSSSGAFRPRWHCRHAAKTNRGQVKSLKKAGIINVQLAGCIAGLGHKDLFMICDGGMPIPAGVQIVDLALCGGVPTFKQTMDAVLSETEVEFYTIAGEITEYNPVLLDYIKEKLSETDYQMIPHTELKEMSKQIKFAVRTGEFTPYPNIILRAGVAFPV